MPIFEGVNAFGWLARIEHFFRVGHYNEEEKLQMVSLSLDGPVLSWYNWRLSRQPFLCWSEFKNDLLHQFSTQAALGRRLFGLKQTGSLADFLTEFHELSSQTPHLTDQDLENIFINGLKPALQDLIIMLNPQGLTALIDAAIRLEPRTICQIVAEASKPAASHSTSSNSSSSNSRQHSYSSWRTRPVSGAQSAVLPTAAASPPTNRIPVVTRSAQPKGRLHLSDSEYADKRRNGICFTCDAKYYHGHNCPNKYLQVLTIIDGCEVELIEDPIEGEVSTFASSPTCMNLSLSTFLGLPSLSTTKVRDGIGKSSVVIMLDSGATHNFISPRLTARAKLKCVPISGCDVLLGNGFSVSGLGVCQKVEFSIASLSFVADFCVLELGGADVILGIQWLRTLGDCNVNWDEHRMSFLHHGKRVTILGDPSLHPRPISLKSFSVDPMLLSIDNISSQPVTYPGNVVPLSLPSAVNLLLSEFEQIFETPTKLPPLRGKEHSIHLLPGTAPVSVRPYRYPHAHQEEMSRQVQTMLADGLIRPSSSPFSSPVLLVAKKDAT